MRRKIAPHSALRVFQQAVSAFVECRHRGAEVWGRSSRIVALELCPSTVERGPIPRETNSSVSQVTCNRFIHIHSPRFSAPVIALAIRHSFALLHVDAHFDYNSTQVVSCQFSGLPSNVEASDQAANYSPKHSAEEIRSSESNVVQNISYWHRALIWFGLLAFVLLLWFVGRMVIWFLFEKSDFYRL